MPATISAPATSPPARAHPSREQLLAAILDPNRLPTPHAVALQVVTAASKPDCDPREIVALLNLDAALCAKLLRAVNSCLYALKQPIASVARAVHVLGLKTVRALALGLSMPTVKLGRNSNERMRDYWVGSVGGGIIARELALFTRRPAPDDDLVAGLLRDMGEVLLQQTYPDTWDEHLTQNAHRLLDDPCEAEMELFGISHADVSAELLRGWRLPDDIVEPIRHHHHPERLAGSAKQRHERAELLHFASMLVQLDIVSQRPALLEKLLTTARERFHLPKEQLVDFLQCVAPKIETFASVLSQDIGPCPDLAAVLADRATELVNITTESIEKHLSGIGIPNGSVVAARSNAGLPPASQSGARLKLPEFRPEFVERLPDIGCKLGEYELHSRIGRGATGVVFKAFEPNQNRFVAIKMLAPDLAALPGIQSRFEREARAAAAIQHENIVAVHAVRETAGVTYLVMDFVDGACLESRIQQHGSMPVPLIIAGARQIAAGLDAAHSLLVLHRDLKPANVLIESETGRVKVSDFGMARVPYGPGLSAEVSLPGTPFYMAPELLHGTDATPLSDLFSLGAVLYEMATGRVPFPGQSVADVCSAVTTCTPVPPRQIRPNMPEWLESIILRLLKKSPSDRCPSATAVLNAFTERGY